MNFYEALNELESLTEGGPAGQATYKDFLVYLANFLGYPEPDNYDHKTWVLHHRDCNHKNNSQFNNLVLMNPNHHHSLHIQCYHDSNKNIWDYLEKGTTKNGIKFEYWLIGEQIAERIDKKVTEDSVETIIEKEDEV